MEDLAVEVAYIQVLVMLEELDLVIHSQEQ
jgi:hypothetical protein